MKRILLSAVVLSSIGLYAQVGINTTEPEATLDVNGDLRVQSMAESEIPSNKDCPCFLVVDGNGKVKRVPVSQGTGTSSGTTTGSGGTAVIGGVSPVEGGVANTSVLTPDVVEIGWGTYQSNFSKVQIAVNLPEGVPYSAYMSPTVDLPMLDNKIRRVSVMYPKGVTDDTGKITATLLFDGDHTYLPKLIFDSSEEKDYKVPLYFNGIKQDNDLILHAGINAMKNREHDKDFLYPVVKIGDKYITAMNLGAEYAKEAATNPAVLKDWVSNNQWRTDIKSYGSMFQWGRAADGHELMKWTSSSSGTPANPGIQWKRDNQLSLSNQQWVCPTGWHVPNKGDWEAVDKAVKDKVNTNAKNSAVYNNDVIRLINNGLRSYSDGSFSSSSYGYYWSSSEYSDASACYMNFNSSNSNPSNYSNRAYGFAVRCLKD